MHSWDPGQLDSWCIRSAKFSLVSLWLSVTSSCLTLFSAQPNSNHGRDADIQHGSFVCYLIPVEEMWGVKLTGVEGIKFSFGGDNICKLSWLPYDVLQGD